MNLGSQGRNIDFTNAPFTRPVKTGSSLPPSCSIGDLFFDTYAAPGQNLYGCPVSNNWIPLGSAQIPAFTGDVVIPAGTTTTTLATVNSNPGTFGDPTHSIQLTVDGKGRITAIAQVSIAGGNASLNAGPLATISTSCAPGALYLATDQPAGQQIYSCSSPNVWTQMGSLGPSGALAFTNGSLDIVTSLVPRIPEANVFTGLNTFAKGIQIQGTGSQPSCGSTTRGVFWYQNNGSSKDSIQVCVFTGSSFSWISLY